MKRLRIVFFTLLAAVIGAPPVVAGPRDFGVVARKVEARFVPETAKPGETVTWRLTIELIPGWHTYPTQQVDPKAEGQVNVIKFPTSPDVIFVDQLQDPPN